MKFVCRYSKVIIRTGRVVEVEYLFHSIPENERETGLSLERVKALILPTNAHLPPEFIYLNLNPHACLLGAIHKRCQPIFPIL